jgi:hypothetical protein
LPAICGKATLAMEVSSTSMNAASETVTAMSQGLTAGRSGAAALASTEMEAAVIARPLKGTQTVADKPILDPAMGEVGARHLPIPLLALLYEKNFVHLSRAEQKHFSTGWECRIFRRFRPGDDGFFVLAGSLADNRSLGCKPLL